MPRFWDRSKNRPKDYTRDLHRVSEEDKISKEEAHYRDPGRGGHPARCFYCINFNFTEEDIREGRKHVPGTCDKVKGWVHSSNVCNLFEASEYFEELYMSHLSGEKWQKKLLFNMEEDLKQRGVL